VSGHVPDHRHSRLRRSLHWASALLVIVVAALGIYLTQILDTDADSAARAHTLFSAHKTLGLAILLLTLVRIATHVRQPMPARRHHRVSVLGAAWAHRLLLLLLVALPVSGLVIHQSLAGGAPIWGFDALMPKGAPSVPRAEIAARAHMGFALLLGLVLLAHVAGALKHHLMDRDTTLTAMTRGDAFATGGRPPARGVLLALTALPLAGILALAVLQGGGAEPRAQDGAGNWTVEYGASRLTITARGGGIDIQANFDRFTTDISFDPDAPETARIATEIDLASWSSGVPAVDETVADENWLHVAAHPTASWAATRVTGTPGAGFVAEGTLTIRGVSAPVALSFTLETQNGITTARGTGSFDRRDLELGRGPAATEDTAAFDIGVEIEIVAERRE